jgi:hypothetical protein
MTGTASINEIAANTEMPNSVDKSRVRIKQYQLKHINANIVSDLSKLVNSSLADL